MRDPIKLPAFRGQFFVYLEKEGSDWKKQQKLLPRVSSICKQF